MTDTTATASTNLKDPDSNDLDRLGASLDYLSTFFREAGDENNAALSSSDARERVAASGGDTDVSDLDRADTVTAMLMGTS